MSKHAVHVSYHRDVVYPLSKDLQGKLTRPLEESGVAFESFADELHEPKCEGLNLRTLDEDLLEWTLIPRTRQVVHT